MDFAGVRGGWYRRKPRDPGTQAAGVYLKHVCLGKTYPTTSTRGPLPAKGDARTCRTSAPSCNTNHDSDDMHMAFATHVFNIIAKLLLVGVACIDARAAVSPCMCVLVCLPVCLSLCMLPGGILVHTVGGMASLIGTYFIGPRAGRFGIEGEVNKDYRDNNGNLVVLGTFLLWFGWCAAVSGASDSQRACDMKA